MRGSESVRLRDARDGESELALRALDVADAPCEVHARAVTCDAGGDVQRVLLLGASRFEELRVVHAPTGSAALRYELALGREMRAREHRGTLEVRDRHGRVAWRTLPAFAVDATGKRRALALSLGERELATESTRLLASWTLDASGLAYPIVVDPEWVSGPGWPDEAVVALNSVWLKQGGQTTGDVAVIDASPGPVLTDAAELVVGQSVTLTGGARANRVRVKVGATVTGQVGTNDLVNNGTVSGAVVTPLVLPLSLTVPALPVFSAGSSDVTLEQHQDLTLAAGAYAQVTLKAGTAADPTVLTLSGGVYDLGGLNLGDRSRVECAAACELRVKERLEPGEHAYLGPAAGSGLGPPDVEVYVEGINGTSGALGGTPKAAALGFDNQVKARIFVSNGTLWLKQGTVATGTFVARDVEVGENVAVSKDVPPACGNVDDGNACTADSCDPATGQAIHDPLPAGTACGDGDACDGDELCDGTGLCQPGAPLSCDDGNGCTADACEPATGCTHTNADGAACDDGDACTQVDACQGGACAGASPVVCTALDQCHDAGACEPSTGACSNPPKAAGAPCSDGSACTEPDACDGAGACQAGATVPVDDGNACTADACDPAGGVTHTPLPAGTSCANATVCDGEESCDGAGLCQPGTPLGTDDGNPCTVDACDPLGGVTHTPLVGAACDDQSACTVGETCDASGSCTGGAPLGCDDGNECTADACAPATGCTHTNADGAACDDGDACTQVDTCQGGACAGASPVVCTALSQCHDAGACEPSTGACSNPPKAAGAPCSDGSACTEPDACDGAGACQAGAAVPVDDGEPCTADLCDPATGAVTHPPAPAGTPCTLDACTTGASCDGAGQCGGGTALAVDDGDACTLDSCDPITGPKHAACSPIDRTVATTIASSMSWLYTGPDAVQSGLDPGTLDARRAAVLRGSVRDRAGVPVPAVAVTVLGHPELGWTTTHADGTFDMVVNGGAELVVELSKAGYFPAQRPTFVPWGELVTVDDVVLTAPDPVVTSLDLSSSEPVQVARGSVVTDGNGSRQATLLIPAGTQALLVLPDGSTQPTSTLSVRATEYTVGPTGPDAMPAPLPPSSVYTYAVELSADEALAVGARGVELSQPAIFYTENFLGFPAGTTVPLGTYDRALGRWSCEPSGIVLAILSTAGGVASVDATGDGLAEGAAELAALGITTAELAELAALYVPGTSLWRTLLTSFSPKDWNWNGGPPNGSGPPPPPPGPDPTDDCEDEQAVSSVLECGRQVIREQIPLAGTPHALHYTSERVPGRRDAYRLRIGLSGATVPGPLKRIELDVEIAGRRSEQSFPPIANQTTEYVWDGRDAYGRLLQGRQPVVAKVKYVYDAVYDQTADFGDYGSGVDLTPNQPRGEVEITREWRTGLGAWDQTALGLGGWSLDAHHAYDPVSKTLLLGDGTRRDAVGQAAVVRNVATFGGEVLSHLAVAPDGTSYVSDVSRDAIWHIDSSGAVTLVAGTPGLPGYSGDGGPATSARINQPRGLFVTDDGTLYFAEQNNHVLRRVTPDGTIDTVAGTGISGYAGDGGPAALARLSEPWDVVVGADGALYVADSSNGRVRKIKTDCGGSGGVISTVAGKGTPGPAPVDEIVATDTTLSPYGLVFDLDGNLYVAGGGFLRWVDREGIIHRLAGSGCQLSSCPSDDGMAALDARLNPQSVAVDRDGTAYFTNAASVTEAGVRAVTPDGILRTVGGGSATPFTDGAAAGSVVVGIGDVALAPNGTLLLVHDGPGGAVRRIAPPLPGIGLTGVGVPSADGTQVYSFDAAGRHVATLDARTGAIRTSFGYDPAGLLASVSDGDGNTTTLEHDPSGKPARVIGPYGHATLLSVDTDGLLASAENPLGERFDMTYVPGAPGEPTGLLETFTNPRGNTVTLSYDPLGRLVLDQDPAGGSLALVRTDTATGWSVVKSTALGIATTYLTEREPDGGFQRTNTFPDGTSATLARGLNDSSDAVTTPDGTTYVTERAADPRLGLLAPIVSRTTATPGGLVRTETLTRTATLSDPADPFSLIEQTDTLNVNGRITTTAFNRPALRTTVTSPAGRVTRTFHDAQMRVLRREVDGIVPLDFVYDPRGRLATITQGPRTRSTAYYATSDTRNGYVQSVTDALTQTTTFTPDAVGRILEQQEPDSAVTAFGWDGDGNLTSVTPPGQPAHGQAFTVVDLLSAYVPPAVPGVPSPATLYAYDVDRRITTTTRPDGLVTARSYDFASRLDLLLTPTGTVDYDYFGLTPCAGCAPGRLERVTDPSGVVLEHQYDGMLLTGLTWSGAVSGGVTFGHDASFRVAAETVTVGATSSPMVFGYDADDITICASPSTCTPAGSDALKLTLDAGNGLVTGSSHGLATDVLTYNAFGELATYTAKGAGSDVFREVVDTAAAPRDALGRIVERTETNGAGPVVWRYTYDLRGRLTDVLKDGVLYEHIEYDGNGNRLLRQTPTESAIGVYDAQDRLLSYGATTYTYSANGELASKTDASGTTTYLYDVRGNLLRVELPSGDVVEYLVDGRDRRVGRKRNGVLERAWLYRNQLSPVAELDGSGALVARFVYASRSNVPDFMVRGGVTYRLFSDHLGSVRAIVDVATGSVVWRADYDAWGNRTVTVGAADFVPFGFAGGVFDAETGLTRFGARDYDAVSGRWTGKDPVRFLEVRFSWRAFEPGNLYVFAANDSLNLVDTTGLVPSPPDQCEPNMTDPCEVPCKALWHAVFKKCMEDCGGSEYCVDTCEIVADIEYEECKKGCK